MRRGQRQSEWQRHGWEQGEVHGEDDCEDTENRGHYKDAGQGETDKRLEKRLKQ